MGSSDHPANYSTIDVVSRVQDVVAVASHIVANTGRAPVVVGWSQGGVITGLLAASAPQLVAGVGFFSVPADGFFVPPQFLPLLQNVVASGADRYLPTPDVIYGIAFGFDPVTGQPTISADAFATFVSMSEPDSVRTVLELGSPDFFNAALVPAWPAIQVPALVVDGAQDAIPRPCLTRSAPHANNSSFSPATPMGGSWRITTTRRCAYSTDSCLSFSPTKR